MLINLQFLYKHRLLKLYKHPTTLVHPGGISDNTHTHSRSSLASFVHIVVSINVVSAVHVNIFGFDLWLKKQALNVNAVVCKALGEVGAVVRPGAALIQTSWLIVPVIVGKLPRQQYLGAVSPIKVDI